MNVTLGEQYVSSCPKMGFPLVFFCLSIFYYYYVFLMFQKNYRVIGEDKLYTHYKGGMGSVAW